MGFLKVQCLVGVSHEIGRGAQGDSCGATAEDEMVGWYHQLDGHEFEQAPGVGDGQGGLASCSSWGHKESDTTERLNWTVAHQAPPSMGFSRQECWSELPFPSPGDLPNSGIKPRAPTLQVDSLLSEPPDFCLSKRILHKDKILQGGQSSYPIPSLHGK